MICSGSPVYAVNKLDMKFHPWRNRTLLGLVSSDDREQVEKISFGINNFFLPFAAFIIITICTTVLVLSLSRGTRWRNSSAESSQTSVSNRSQKVIKMVVMISVLYIGCFCPSAIITLTMTFVSDISLGGKNINIGIILSSSALILESINSSCNIFIYYHVSTKYKVSFRNIFWRNKI